MNESSSDHRRPQHREVIISNEKDPFQEFFSKIPFSIVCWWCWWLKCFFQLFYIKRKNEKREDERLSDDKIKLLFFSLSMCIHIHSGEQTLLKVLQLSTETCYFFTQCSFTGKFVLRIYWVLILLGPDSAPPTSRSYGCFFKCFLFHFPNIFILIVCDAMTTAPSS